MTREQLLAELARLGERVAELEASQCQNDATEEALRESEEKHRRLIENLKQEYFFYRHGTDGVFTYLSPSITTVLGYGVDEFKTHYTQCMTDNPVNRDVVRYSELAVAGLQQPPYEVEMFHKNGTIRWLEVLEQPIRDERGNVVCVEGIAHDITARKAAEDALRREHERLRRMSETADHELRTISYEIHDGIAQMLSAVAMHFQSYAHLKKDDPEAAASAWNSGQELLAKCLLEARRLIRRVRLPLLDERGVAAAIKDLVDETNQQSEMDIVFQKRTQFDRLDPPLENAIYRVVQEGLANAQRHSGSANASVELTQQGGRVRVEIRDWGTGFDPENLSGDCFGLIGIRERARMLKGRAVIKSAPGEGTRILVELPLIPVEEDEMRE